MLTDFGKIKGLLLSYPKNFKDKFTSALCPVYDNLIDLIPADIDVHLILNSNNHVEDLKKQFSHKKLNFIIIPDFNEIWLRDILGFSTGNEVIKPCFLPSYFRGFYKPDYLKLLHKQTDQILEHLNLKVKKIDLIWDGGNFVHNGKVGIITDKLLLDNSKLKKNEIIEIINDHLSITPVFIPTAPGDQLGHADGYLAFINNYTLTLSNYPPIPFLKKSVEYREQLLSILSKLDISIIDIFDRPVSEIHRIGKEFLESSRGVYNNFLQVNETAILPQFTIPKDRFYKDYLQINKNILSKYFYSVNSVNCDALSKLGGVLHCISWTY